MQKIIYGLDTGSVEDYDQCVVVLVPDDAANDDLLEGASPQELGLTVQTIVTWEDVRDALDLAMKAEGIGIVTRAKVLTTVRDAVDNND